MTFSSVDWTVMWRLYHHPFFWIYFILGIPLRLVAARLLGASFTGKTGVFAVVASVVSAASSTWFPIIPIICGAVLILAKGDAAGQSLAIGVPLVAFSMAIEGTLLDAACFRALIGKSRSRWLMFLLVANVLNASIALAFVFAWIVRHPPHMLAFVK